jgi:alkyl sulfatase BDS1-like metallo-beta-lactamase superfamily hydrolase
MSDSDAVHPTVAAANEALALRLPFADRRDYDDAVRGRIGSLSDPLIRGSAGRVVWDVSAYDFLDADCPATANPSLWRQSQLAAIHGLFEVTDGVYQVRGLDLSNMTLVEGERGVIVIDPLISTETAAAALALYRRHRGERPVTALIYTHSHVDHFGGARGVVDDADLARGIPVIAPEGFLHHAASENVFAGTAMVRRAAYMYGAALEKGPAGQIGAGLGQTTSTGNVTLIPPTLEITESGQTLEIDGVRIEFQLTPGTEAPAEMNFYFPDRRALCIAENATHNLHNVLTLRGALVRDARIWAAYLDEAVELFAARTDVMFAQHHWPCWGEARIREFLGKQRDLYAYIHDQTLRMINRGMTGAEIAEDFELPESLDLEWHLRGYYGSVSHNVKAVYQRYMGWFDGNPAHLWQHPPVAAAERYVKLAGGADAAVAAARTAYEDGDLRWAAELLSHVLFADQHNAEARELQASVFDQLAYGAESGPWRNFFLTGAFELRHGVVGSPTEVPPDFVKGLSTEQIFSSLAVRVDGLKAAGRSARTRWVFPDTGEKRTANLENGVLTHRDGASGETDVTVTVDRAALNRLLAQETTIEELAASGGVQIEGDATALAHIFGCLEAPDPAFAIVTP